MRWAILKLYYSRSEETGYYNSQEIGLARALSSKGEDVIVVEPKRNIKNERFEKIENKIYILYVPSKTFGIHSFYKLNFLLEKKIDVVHLNSDNQIFAPEVIKFCQKHHILFYNYIGTIYSDSNYIFVKALMGMVSRRNIFYFKRSPVITKTLAVKKQLEKLGIKNIKNIPVGLDTTQLKTTVMDKKTVRQYLNLPIDKKILLFVGRLENYKRPFASLEILKHLGNEYHLIIIGDGSLAEKLKDRIQQKFKNSVSYFSKIPNSSMGQYYKACDWYINLNTHEIFGMSILEAMYQGCLVIARRAPGPEEIIEDKISGYLCDSDQEMETIIKTASENNIRQQAVQRITSCFTWDQSARQLLKFIETLKSQSYLG